MQAAIYHSYGSADVVALAEVPVPDIGPDEILIQVHASAVTQGDRRIREADFPGVSALLGRLMFGVFRPKNPGMGTVFAGRVTAVGADVTRFAVGDDVFGVAGTGAHAEYLRMPADGVVGSMPAGLSYEEAASIPYGAGTAMTFLADMAKVQRGERVLVVGASGGVGLFAVQVAKHLGAEVTAVGSSRSHELLQRLGADHVIDYKAQDFTESGEQYDVIFDTPNTVGFGRARRSLTPKGRYLSLHIELGVLAHMLITSITGGRRLLFGVALGSPEQMSDMRRLVDRGAIQPVVDQVFGFDAIHDAHAHLDDRRSHGTVVVSVREPELRVAAAK